MAKKRMFSLDIIDTDKFLDLPPSTQNLYFQLGMRADDDGFVASPNRITKLCGAKKSDYSLLQENGYIINFEESGVCVITDWKVNNYIQKDRYTETRYLDLKAMLCQRENGSYTRLDTKCIQDVYTVDTQISIDKYSIDKYSIGNAEKEKKEPSKDQSRYNKPRKYNKNDYTPKSKFNNYYDSNYDHNNIDYDALEEELLNKMLSGD